MGLLPPISMFMAGMRGEQDREMHRQPIV